MSGGDTPSGPAAPTNVSGGNANPAPIVIETQSPPPPQRVQKETNYVQVPVDSPELQGMQMALDYLVKKNPGATPFVESVKSYAKQFVSGLGGTKPATGAG